MQIKSSIFFLLGLFFFIISHERCFASNTSLILSILPDPIYTEDTVYVDAIIKDAQQLNTVSLMMSYDPAFFEAQDGNTHEYGLQLQEGDLFKENERHCLINSFNNINGGVEYVAGIIHPYTPVSGDGLLVRLTLAPKKAGHTTIQITQKKFVSRDGNAFVPDGETNYDLTILAPVFYTITATSGENGNIQPSGQISLIEHSSQPFQIIPDQGAYISDVLIDGKSVGVSSGYTFTNITEHSSIHAVFRPIFYTVYGEVKYTGTQMGCLHVLARPVSDPNTISDEKIYLWDNTTKICPFRLQLQSGEYTISAYLDVGSRGSDSTRLAEKNEWEPSGVYTAGIINIDYSNDDTLRNFSMFDPSPNQVIFTKNNKMYGQEGKQLRVHLNYYASDANSILEESHFLVHYNATILEFSSLSNELTEIVNSPVSRLETAEENDGDASTNNVIDIKWLYQNTNEDLKKDLPFRLCTVTFLIKGNMNDTANIHFTRKSASSNYAFYGEPLTFQVAPFHIDIDGNGVIDALTDGMIILGYLFGKNDIYLESVSDQINGTRINANEIKAYISENLAKLDIDCNGITDTLTDGMLVLRYLFGFDEGESLLADAVDTISGTCITEDEIVTNIKNNLLFK